MTDITIILDNKTGLDSSKYTIYLIGFSSSSKKMLSPGTQPKTAKFVEITSKEGILPAYKLETEITKIIVDTTTNPLPKIVGARIYFFVAENSKFPTAPEITYSNYGADVTNVKNPPNPDVPPYTFSEFTLENLSYGAVIDSQTVDGFVFPVTITLNDSLGQVGQPLTVNRDAILDAYIPFMTGLGSSGDPFKCLKYTVNNGGLLNPGAYLSEISDKGEFTHLDSPLNSKFDNDLKKLFSNNTLAIQGVAKGDIAADIYTAVSGEQKLPGSTFSHQALQFKGKVSGETFNIYSPVGLCVLNYTKNGVAAPIIGSLDNTILTFSNPLPDDTPLVEGMFVQGAGVNPNTTIQKITCNDNKEITKVELSAGIGIPAPNSQYRFSKVNNMFLTSGNMVFANNGVFAYAEGITGDAQAVILNLQNQIVTALNRGVANLAPDTGTDGYTTKYWATQTNWYPENEVQNLFSLFMHTGTTDDNTPIFLQASNAAECARGTKMGQAYGFAYDENAGPIPPAPTGQPEVPSKFDPLPKATTTITITLGPWND